MAVQSNIRLRERTAMVDGLRSKYTWLKRLVDKREGILRTPILVQ